ncbi:MAG: glycosyltransferase family 39 protein [Chloroflexi bacterium]|nr:glycosyltransferase family 39 protein [Chloroflexota bacterium]
MKKTQDDSDNNHPPSTLFGRSRILLYTCLIVLFALGIGFRLLNLPNPPLDIHAWRSLGSAAFARGLYYQMSPNADPQLRQQAIGLAAATGHDEPTITETLVALSYLVAGGEYLWIFRLWTTLFWVIGGVALFALVRRMTSVDGAMVALGYYLLLPFGNTTTRCFLPEPLMVMWIILALFALYRWVESQTWKWTITAGVLAGLAVLTKVFAVFPLAPAIILVNLSAFGFRRTVTNLKFWIMVALAGVIPAAYYIFPNPQSGGGYLGVWVLPFLGRLKDITFYISWLHHLNGSFNLAIVLIAIASTFLLKKRWRAMCLGLWIGYGLLGAAVPELIYSHMYYNLPLVAIIAISLGPISALVLGKISEQGRLWRVLFFGVALVGVGYSVFMSRKEVVAVDYRAEPEKWRELAAKIPNVLTAGLTEDYGMELNYYGWKFSLPYPYSFDQDMSRMAGHEFDVTADNLAYFKNHVGDSGFFVITMLNELDAQPYLKKILYDNYPIYAQGDWYIIFDLR